jgi:hypothetical protein
MYFSDKYDMVKPFLLDELIASKRVKRFRRSDGWAIIGIDAVRGKGGSYRGPERRKTSNYPLEV